MRNTTVVRNHLSTFRRHEYGLTRYIALANNEQQQLKYCFQSIDKWNTEGRTSFESDNFFHHFPYDIVEYLMVGCGLLQGFHIFIFHFNQSDLVNSIRYLNQFLSPPHRMKYIRFDMARKSRGGDNVMEMLPEIAESVLQQTGMFLKARGLSLSFQTSIVRTNCVDCLNRTNTAQFAIGKCALGHQLECLGFLKSAKLEFDSECVTMLENFYEEHGDTLALQYGGSQLVHSIKTYRKTAAWVSQRNDIMQSLNRYYRNTFNDTEKQYSVNLFLGYYMPSKGHNMENQPVWEQHTNYFMHNVYQPSSLTEETLPITDQNETFHTKLQVVT